MVTGLIGKKVGMTQVYQKDGSALPATVIKAGPCVVLQMKTKATDGYESVQLGLVEDKPAKTNKALGGHYKKAGVPPTRARREIALVADKADKQGSDPSAETNLKPGDQLHVTMLKA